MFYISLSWTLPVLLSAVWPVGWWMQKNSQRGEVLLGPIVFHNSHYTIIASSPLNDKERWATAFCLVTRMWAERWQLVSVYIGYTWFSFASVEAQSHAALLLFAHKHTRITQTDTWWQSRRFWSLYYLWRTLLWEERLIPYASFFPISTPY